MARYSFGQFLLDIDEHRLCRQGEELRLRGKAFDALCLLVESGGRLLRKDELLRKIWPDAVVEENNLDHCISLIRKTLGGEPSQYVETIPRKGYRFVCAVRRLSETRNVAELAPGKPALPGQEIHRFLTGDGVTIAYSRCGTGPPLVKAANWLNHLEFEWQSPIWAHWVSELSKHHTLYRFDERGNGLSDWNIQDFSFSAWVRDLEELVETVKLEKFALFGISQGGAVAIAYAARHPERVSKLVLYGSFARGVFELNVPRLTERFHAMLTLIRSGWGKGNPAFRQLWTTMFMPEATAEQANWFNELQRVTTSPENAAKILEEIGRINVLDLLPRIQCPTLILHCNRDTVIPVPEGRMLAARIPHAKFVELPSRNHLVIPPEPAWEEFLDAFGEFMEWDKGAATAQSR